MRNSIINKRGSLLLIIALFMVMTLMIPAGLSYADSMDPAAGETGADAECLSVPAEKLLTPDMIPNKGTGGKSGAPGSKIRRAPGASTETYIPTAVIVIGLNNMYYYDKADWSARIFTQSRCLKEYFRDMSYGKMTFEPVSETSVYGNYGNTCVYDSTNDGIIHVKVSRDHADWGAWDDPVTTRKMVEVFIDAVKKAADYVDFPSYDKNNDGQLSTDELALVFIVAGYDYGAAKKEYADAYYLRSHRSTIGSHLTTHKFTDLSKPKVTRNGKTVTLNPYVAISERVERENSNGTIVKELGRVSSLAHELGHHLGLPDLYDKSEADSKPWRVYSYVYFIIHKPIKTNSGSS